MSETWGPGPHGYADICDFYGFNPREHMTVEGKMAPQWYAANIVRITLPAPLRLSWAPEVEVVRASFHKRVAPFFEQFHRRVFDAGLWSHLDPFGGAYNFRRKRGGGRLSMHALGGAADYDPDGNPMGAGTNYSMPSDVIAIAHGCGLTWGGEFDDPMHFQVGSGY